jgi:3-deoxy-7-phosphoheptulonate synthase
MRRSDGAEASGPAISRSVPALDRLLHAARLAGARAGPLWWWQVRGLGRQWLIAALARVLIAARGEFAGPAGRLKPDLAMALVGVLRWFPATILLGAIPGCLGGPASKLWAVESTEKFFLISSLFVPIPAPLTPAAGGPVHGCLGGGVERGDGGEQALPTGMAASRPRLCPAMLHRTDDLRIEGLSPLLPPAILMEELPLSERASETVANGRAAITGVLRGADDRLIVVVGPCSIHDPAAALDYAARLKPVAAELARDLVVVMRVYFEKPRTTVGWKGLINDPDLDGSFRINKGLHLARKLLCDLADLGLPAGCEFLDPITPQFIADLVGWGAIGARTTESQVHRELASGLSVPVGFKNGTDGNLQIAIDAIRSAAHPHRFLSVSKQGVAAIVATRGNPDTHVILRGAAAGPNFASTDVASACATLAAAGLPQRVMIDCSHGNSAKDHRRQVAVGEAIAAQLRAGSHSIIGTMIESHLLAGRQNVPSHGGPAHLAYGQSITDACLGWDATVPVLHALAAAVAARRSLAGPSSA